MKRLFALPLILILFSVSLQTIAGKGLTDSEAQTFMHDSGLDMLISTMPEAMEQQLNLQRLTETNQLEFEEAQAAIKQAVNNIQNLNFALEYLGSYSDADSLRGAMTFLASPLGQRISVEEREASSADAQLEMQKYAMQMAKNPPTPERIKLIQELAEALNADEMIITIIKGALYSLLDVTEGLTPEASDELRVALDEEWKKIEPMLDAQFGDYIIMAAHYSYRNLSDADLKAYNEFLATASGQTYWNVSIDIVKLYMKEFAKELVGIFKEKKQ